MKLSHFALAGLMLAIAAGIYLTLQNDMDGRLEAMKSEMQADSDRRLREQEKALKDQIAASAKAAEEARKQLTENAKSKLPGAIAQAVENDPTVKEALEKVKALNTAENPGEGVAAAPPDFVPGAANATDPEARMLAQEEERILSPARFQPNEGSNAGSLEQAAQLTQLQAHIAGLPRIARVKNANPVQNEGFVVLDQGAEVGINPGDSFAVRRGTAIIGHISIGNTVRPNECVANVQAGKFITGIVIREGDDIIRFQE
jgi:cell shape-determining protein MreC